MTLYVILNPLQCFPSAIASHVVSEYPNRCLVSTRPNCSCDGRMWISLELCVFAKCGSPWAQSQWAQEVSNDILMHVDENALFCLLLSHLFLKHFVTFCSQKVGNEESYLIICKESWIRMGVFWGRSMFIITNNISSLSYCFFRVYKGFLSRLRVSQVEVLIAISSVTSPLLFSASGFLSSSVINFIDIFLHDVPTAKVRLMK